MNTQQIESKIKAIFNKPVSEITAGDKSTALILTRVYKALNPNWQNEIQEEIQEESNNDTSVYRLTGVSCKHIKK